MNENQNFIKLQKSIHQKEIESIKARQEEGTYPKEFDFPLGVQLELTAKCNLNCKHCYNRSAALNDSKMTIDDWKGVVNDIIAHGGVFQTIISGGEPLMVGPKLTEIMNPLHDDGTGFVLITNGYLVDDKWVNLLKKYRYYWIQVSIDHLLEAEHDDFREKKGSWKKAVNAALSFSAAGLPLRIAHSLTPKSIDYLPDFADFVYKLGAKSLVCGEIFLSGRVNEHRDLLMSEQDKDKMHAVIKQLQKEYQGKLTIYPSADEHTDMMYHQQVPNTTCIIRPNGDVRLDCTMPFTMGNVFEKPFSTIWKEQGNKCWKSEQVTSYIKNYSCNQLSRTIINHVTDDIKLY